MVIPKHVVSITFTVVFGLFFSVLITPSLQAGTDKIIGVKIYEPQADIPQLFKKWKNLGINTAFISDTLAADKRFMQTARQNKIKTFVIVPIFCSPDKPVQDSLYARTGYDKKAADEWVHFVCPNRQEWKNERLSAVRDIISNYKPDGISIDFIRFFVYWEKVFAAATLDPLDNTCFCSICLDKMQKDLDFRFPRRLKSVQEKAQYVLTIHEEKFIKWKCAIIADMVKSIADTARKCNPQIILNAHIVPWRRADFNNGLKRIAGQDTAAIAKYVDFLSPMCYSHMVKQNPAWVGDVVRDQAEFTNNHLLPSIQVTEAYLKEPCSVENFERALRYSLKAPSAGVVFWNWKALNNSPEKSDVVKKHVNLVISK